MCKRAEQCKHTEGPAPFNSITGMPTHLEEVGDKGGAGAVDHKLHRPVARRLNLQHVAAAEVALQHEGFEVHEVVLVHAVRCWTRS